MPRPVYVYSLVIDYPDVDDEVMEKWSDITMTEPEYFKWPQERRFLSKKGAEDRASLLRDLKCYVDIIKSQPVELNLE